MLKTVVVNIGYIMFGMYLCYEKNGNSLGHWVAITWALLTLC